MWLGSGVRSILVSATTGSWNPVTGHHAQLVVASAVNLSQSETPRPSHHPGVRVKQPLIAAHTGERQLGHSRWCISLIHANWEASQHGSNSRVLTPPLSLKEVNHNTYEYARLRGAIFRARM